MATVRHLKMDSSDSLPTSPAAAAEAGEGAREMRFRFDGTTLDYYGVFLVNVLLTVVTLGIYSAWAKVRNRRFFYGNTLLDGHAFEFDARPASILISRLIIVAVLVAASFSDEILGWVWGGVGLFSSLILLLFPFAVVRGRAFNARHTLHRTVRFRYLSVYWPSYLLFFAYFLPALALFAAMSVTSDGGIREPADWVVLVATFVWLYLLAAFPAYHLWRHRIMVNQLKFGKLGCEYTARMKTYYYHALIAFLLNLIAVVVIGAAAFAAVSGITSSVDPADPDSFGLVFIIIFFSIVFMIFAGYGIYRSRIIPVFYSSVRLSDGSALKCTVTARRYFFAYATVNFLAIVLSFGLLLPWVRVRTWRYISENLRVVLSPETGAVLAGPEEGITPLAEELADVSGFDFDFGMI